MHHIKRQMNTVAIIGGGASGMAAALAAREFLDTNVILLERQSRVGRKLLATGNGRCNLTNMFAEESHYHGKNRDFILPALTRFDVSDTLEWFRAMGLLTRQEPGGRIYPLSNTAGSVLDVLRLAMQTCGVDTMCAFDAVKVERDSLTFTITSASGKTVEADRLIVACGGAAGERLGGTKSGYELLASLGHRRTALYPSLVQLKTDNTWTRAMKGVRTQAQLTLERGSVLAEAKGEIQFTEYGITGPAVYDISRTASVCGEGSVLVLRLLPELSKVDIMEYLIHRQSYFPSFKAENLLSGCLHNSIGRTILRREGIALDSYLWSLTESQLQGISARIMRFELPVLGTLGFAEAQVTAGGMDTAEFKPETMASRLVPGLYACGEVLDIDGDCGGFNLQWAWSSGRLAGLSAAGGAL